MSLEAVASKFAFGALADSYYECSARVGLGSLGQVLAWYTRDMFAKVSFEAMASAAFKQELQGANFFRSDNLSLR